MLLKIMGFLDVLTAIAIVLFQFEVVATRTMLSFIAYLLIKGSLFSSDPATIIDAGIAIYILLMIFHPFIILTIITSFYLFQKGVFSLI